MAAEEIKRISNSEGIFEMLYQWSIKREEIECAENGEPTSQTIPLQVQNPNEFEFGNAEPLMNQKLQLPSPVN